MKGIGSNGFRRLPWGTVSLVHAGVLGLLFLVFSESRPPRPPEHIRVRLLTVKPASPAPKTPGAGHPTRPKRPTTKKKQTSGRKKIKYRTPEDVRRQFAAQNRNFAQKIRGKKATRAQNSAPVHSVRPTVGTTQPSPSAQEIKKHLLNGLNPTTATDLLPATTDWGAATTADYSGRLLALLRRYWRQPTRAETPDGATVTIRLRIQQNGKILDAKPITLSGNAAMDRSVKQLLREIRQAPVFPNKSGPAIREFRIILRLSRSN